MVSRKWWVRRAGMLGLVAAVAVSTGCSKQLARLKLNKARSTLEEARKYNGDKHAKGDFDGASTLISQSDNQMNLQQYKEAKATASQASQTASNALATAKRMEAEAQRIVADHEVEIMNYNNGALEGADLYKQILELQKKMHQRLDKEKWVAAIELANEIKQKVEQLLLRLRTAAEADKVAVQAEYQRLLLEGGRQYALNYVELVEGLMRQIDENTTTVMPSGKLPIKNYKRASALAKEGLRDANDGITESKRKRCEISIEKIYAQLVQAKEKRAEYFRPEQWNACSDDFSKLIDNFWKKEYDFVLNASERLLGQVKNLVYETRKASADFQINRLDNRLSEMKSKGVEQYVPGKLAPLDASLIKARDLYKQAQTPPEPDKPEPPNLFEDVETLCKSSQTTADEIMKEFRNLADRRIGEARNVANRAQILYKDMERIFQDVPTGRAKPLDQKFEENKDALKADLGKRLSNAQSNLSLAEVKLSAEDYRDAIELSRTVQDEDTSIIATIFNVVAYNVISVVEEQVTRYEGEGATIYAPKEVALTRKLLEEAKQLRDKGDPQGSSAKAAEARAELEVTIQAIEVAASQAIEKAETELKRSNEAKTAELRPDDYQRAQQAINEARLQLQTTRLSDAIHTAQRAEALVRQAAQDAARIWATQTLKQSEGAIADATRSGADINAAELLRDGSNDATQAGKVFESAEALLGQKKFDEARGKYLEAKNLAVQATEEATRAKFRLIDEAEAAVVEARYYGAWRTDLQQMTDAVLLLNQAKEALGRNEYAQADGLARKARDLSERLTKGSKTVTFQKRVDLVNDLFGEATRSGGQYYSAKDLAAMQRDLEKMRTQFAPDLFDTNDKQVTDIEARLQDMVKQMPNVFAGWLKTQQDRIAALEKAENPPSVAPQLSEARKYLRYAEMDFQKGKYRNSYSELLTGRRILNELQGDQAETEYQKSVRGVINDLNQAMKDFDSFLSIDSKTLMGLLRSAGSDSQFIAIAGKAKPADFRTRIESLIIKYQAVKPPATMKQFHAEVGEMLNLARTAAIYYERLTVLGEYDDATRRDIVKKACDSMANVRTRVAAIEKSMLPRQSQREKI